MIPGFSSWDKVRNARNEGAFRQYWLYGVKVNNKNYSPPAFRFHSMEFPGGCSGHVRCHAGYGGDDGSVGNPERLADWVAFYGTWSRSSLILSVAPLISTREHRNLSPVSGS